jgi:hypothetical protein
MVYFLSVISSPNISWHSSYSTLDISFCLKLIDINFKQNLVLTVVKRFTGDVGKHLLCEIRQRNTGGLGCFLDTLALGVNFV